MVPIWAALAEVPAIVTAPSDGSDIKAGELLHGGGSLKASSLASLFNIHDVLYKKSLNAFKVLAQPLLCCLPKVRTAGFHVASRPSLECACHSVAPEPVRCYGFQVRPLCILWPGQCLLPNVDPPVHPTRPFSEGVRKFSVFSAPRCEGRAE